MFINGDILVLSTIATQMTPQSLIRCSEENVNVVCSANPTTACRDYCLSKTTIDCDLQYCVQYNVDYKTKCSPCSTNFFSEACQDYPAWRDYCVSNPTLCLQQCTSKNASEACQHPWCQSYAALNLTSDFALSCNPCIDNWDSAECQAASVEQQQVYCNTSPETLSKCQQQCYQNEATCYSHEFCHEKNLCNPCALSQSGLSLNDSTCLYKFRSNDNLLFVF